MDYAFSRGGGLLAGDAEVVGGEQGDGSTPSGSGHLTTPTCRYQRQASSGR